MERLLFFAILTYLEVLSFAAQQASIVAFPISVNITINATANFTCTAIADEIQWLVNGQSSSVDDVRSKGFDDEAVPLTLLNATQNLYTRTLSAFGSVDNNGSNITCVAFSIMTMTLVESEPAVLLVFNELPGKLQQQQQICTARDDMIIQPFPLMSLFTSPYTYHGSCEHTLLTSCGLIDTFTINVDFSAADLSLGKVGVRIGRVKNAIVVLENMTVDTEGFDDPVRSANGVEVLNGSVVVSVSSSNVSISITELGIIVTVINDTVNQTRSVVIDLTEYNTTMHGDVCGLCGSQNGELICSDAVTIVEQRARERLQEFARSWQVNPGEEILHQLTRDCGMLTNDTVFGEALFTVPLLTNLSVSQSLCYEIYGSAGTIFNLISDRCVSVNAHYTAMLIPENGNVITSVGIMAVDNAGQCIGVSITVANQCVPVIVISSATQTFSGTYSRHGLSVRRSLQRVRVSVTNCENVQLVMWAICESEGARQQIRLRITRGLNLRPTSHGLIGQFWNTLATVQPHSVQLSSNLIGYFNQSNLFVVSLLQRQFVAERFHRSWDLSLQSCLYAGSSQGGALSDIPGPKDSVIEGRYTQYIVDNLLQTNYTYSRFDEAFCSTP